MNIVLGKENVAELKDKYIVLELDTLKIPNNDEPVTAYCLVEKVPLDQMLQLENLTELHSTMMENYRKKNWSYCEQAIEHLIGKWNGDLDTFYRSLQTRIENLKDSVLPTDWSGAINK